MIVVSTADNSDYWCENSLGFVSLHCYPWPGYLDEWPSVKALTTACIGAWVPDVGLPRHSADGELQDRSLHAGAVAP